METKLLPKKTYLAMIAHAEGSNLFRNLYATVDGEEQDLLKDGVRACAFFVSILLHSFKLVESPHATISGLERDMQKSGWRTTGTPQLGDVIVWEPMLQSEHVNPHIGFFMGGDEAVSNDWHVRVPARHHLTYGTKSDGTPARAITAFYTHDFLA